MAVTLLCPSWRLSVVLGHTDRTKGRAEDGPVAGAALVAMIEPLEETVARAERARDELAQLLEQLRAERDGVKSAATEAHEAVQALRSAVREAKEEIRQTSKAEARKHLARQMRAAADILARES